MKHTRILKFSYHEPRFGFEGHSYVALDLDLHGMSAIHDMTHEMWSEHIRAKKTGDPDRTTHTIQILKPTHGWEKGETGQRDGNTCGWCISVFQDDEPYFVNTINNQLCIRCVPKTHLNGETS